MVPFSATCVFRGTDALLLMLRMQLERKCSVKKKTVKKPKDSAKPPNPPPKPAELDQDPGGGYNPNHTFPQT
jgi:hypothetical protein